MKYPALFIFFFFYTITQASDLQISNALLYQENETVYTVVSLKWHNAWKNDINNDAAWLFFKVAEAGNDYKHLKVSKTGHEIVSDNTEGKLEIVTTDDQLGVFVQPKSNYRGTIEMTLKITLEESSFSYPQYLYSADFKAYGIEMVYIPQGKFTLGDPDTNALDFGSFYLSGKDGEFKELFMIESETEEIAIGDNENNLYYRAKNHYQGDQTGTVPASFPKGVDAFYIMKYEPSQGQYVDFLNSLNDEQSQFRANFGGKEYYENRGSINIKNGRYFSSNPNAICNYMSWDDAMAYADWTGLRPLTEFEFTKATRGISKPSAHEFPWGTDNKFKLQRLLNKNGEYIMLNGWDESQLSGETKEVFGASYYWVMDLAGGMWERVITVGHEKGRSFEGSHGDGELSGNGFATNSDWPSGIDAKGVGFRGGGFYEPGRGYNAYNPFSPIAYRPYGAYSGGQRTKAYGARFCRTHK